MEVHKTRNKTVYIEKCIKAWLTNGKKKFITGPDF